MPFLGCYQRSILEFGDMVTCGGKASYLFGGFRHRGESFHKRKESMVRLEMEGVFAIAFVPSATLWSSSLFLRVWCLPWRTT